MRRAPRPIPRGPRRGTGVGACGCPTTLLTTSHSACMLAPLRAQVARATPAMRVAMTRLQRRPVVARCRCLGVQRCRIGLQLALSCPAAARAVTGAKAGAAACSAEPGGLPGQLERPAACMHTAPRASSVPPSCSRVEDPKGARIPAIELIVRPDERLQPTTGRTLRS